MRVESQGFGKFSSICVMLKITSKRGSVKIFSSLHNCIGTLRLLIRLQLHGAIYRHDSFVLVLRYCANLKAIRYESTSLNRIVADKSHRVIVALRRQLVSDLNQKHSRPVLFERDFKLSNWSCKVNFTNSNL